MEAIVIAFVIQYGLPFLFKLLHKWLTKKFGVAVMDLSDTNVSTLQKHIDAGLMTGAQAESANVLMIQEATRQSPPIGDTMAKLINLTSFANYIAKHKPEKFAEWVGKLVKWEKSPFRKTTTDYSLMGLYINPPPGVTTKL